jgi:N-methylhydantoinase A
MAADGTVMRPLDEAAAHDVARRVGESGARAVAIAFISAYRNPAHERRMAEILHEQCPALAIATSADTRAKHRELGRFVTTVIRAALLPIMSDYLERFEAALRARGFTGSLLILKGNGGMMHADLARERPEELIESGPAGGVAYARHLSRQIKAPRIIHTDMGGTTFDTSIVEDGAGLITHDYHLDWDMPVIVPMLDIRSVGAGGGSIAWIDDGGSLRVGPRSAGAEPGPICYGQGGSEVTVTDANLLLGRLEPTLGGKMALDAAALRPAFEELGRRIGLEALQLAEGIIAITCENMARAIKMVLIDRGRDPRDFTLASCGGAGPMHACFIARAMSIPRITVPAHAGVASAFGATVTDIRHDLEAFFYHACDEVSPDALNAAYGDLERRARALIARDGAAAQVTIERSAEMRYVGQNYEVMTAIPGGAIDGAGLDGIVTAFHRAHLSERGVAETSGRVMFVGLGVSAAAPGQTALPPRAANRAGATTAEPARRDVYFNGAWHDAKIVRGEDMAPGRTLHGPAIVEARHSCCVLPPGSSAEIDGHGNLVIDIVVAHGESG